MSPLGPKQPRLQDPDYLRWLRRQKCACGCHLAPPCDAAHLRASSPEYNKPGPGIGQKPDDRWALPLKHQHHMDQHRFGNEVAWWKAHGVADPFALCLEYYRRYQERDRFHD